MNSALSPREIQARLRAGSSVTEVAEEAGVDEEAIAGFAGPVLAEREHIAQQALVSTVRRRGEGNTHRRLGELLQERLQQRGIDATRIEWDAWRQEDLRWRVVGTLTDDAGSRKADFVFDHKARFSVAENSEARWMIGEDVATGREDDESTVDFDDELALLRATSEGRSAPSTPPGDEVPESATAHDDHEDTSELDALYDMLSGVSEDSVRIYTGFDEDDDRGDEAPEAADEEETEEVEPEPAPQESTGEAQVLEPVQDSLVEEPEQGPEPKAEKQEKPRPKKRSRRGGRAHVPSWDEIMFGGPPNKKDDGGGKG